MHPDPGGLKSTIFSANSSILRHILIVMINTMDRISKAAILKKETIYKGAALRFTADLSNKILQAQRH